MAACGVEKFAKDLMAAYHNAIRSWKIDTKYLQLAGAGFLLILIAVFGYVGQNWYISRQTMAAQKSYADCAQLLNDARESGAREGWMQVDRVAKSEYGKHASSSFAPYFKLLESQALSAMDDKAGALTAAREAQTLVRKGSPFAGQITLHTVLLELDSDDEAIRAQGLESLKNFAFDQNAADRDAALYMLGRYHWARGEVAEAAEVWQELVRTYQAEDGFSSAWAQQAAQLLEYVPEQ